MSEVLRGRCVKLWVTEGALPDDRSDPDVKLGAGAVTCDHDDGVICGRLRPIRGLWRVDHVEPARGKPDPNRRGSRDWFLVPRSRDVASPVLAPELWVEESPATEEHGFRITVHKSQGPVRFDGWAMKAGVHRLPPDHAGHACAVFGGARLLVGVVPRHLRIDDAVAGEDLPRALQTLHRMVGDLRAAQVGVFKDAPQDAPSVTLHEGERERSWRQELDLLAWLVEHEGVRGAWQALIQDPVVRLVQEFPIRDVARAARPVVHGARGPWSLADGWSDGRADGRVRDRRVERSVDTPPSRLAVRTAASVSERLLRVRREMSGERQAAAWDALAESLLADARRVLNAPSLQGVSRDAPLALDTASLQTNARCRPLLRAWRRLQRGVDVAGPFDDVLRDPLGKTHEVYERWCWLQVNEALGCALGDDGQRGASEDPPERSFRRAAIKSGLTSKTAQISWSLASTPDGIIDGPLGFLVWDAKYQEWQRQTDRGSTMVYQAHAFRDAVRLERHKDRQAAWSLVLFAGRGDAQYFCSAAHRPHDHHVAPKNLSVVDAEKGGVALLRIPPVADGLGPELERCRCGSPYGHLHRTIRVLLRCITSDPPPPSSDMS